MTDTAAQPEAPKKTTLTVLIDGTPVEANPGELVIAAAERAGTYIPRFCWHPRMREVGMCRMCLVEVSGPRGMSLQPSCMIPAAEGMVVDTKSDTVKKAQDGVLEFLLVNHPLDCPVCDKGGECPLQDQTLTFGPGESRFVEEKRHYEKPISISDLVLLDRERCILCDRCTRFSKEVAGDPLIHFINRGNATEVNTFPDDPFASYFSGNVVQICPVGALTAQPYRFAARPWDLDQVESTCTSCAVGCKVVVQSSGDEITRTQGVDSDPVNWGWLCDKGRFDYEAITSTGRLTHPMRTANGKREQITWNAALAEIASKLKGYKPEQIGFIGGARLTNEDQYAFAKLAKSILGTDNVDAQLADGLPAKAWLGLPKATIDEAANASAIILIGPDVKEELPVLFLRLRDAAANRRTPIIEFSSIGSGMSKYAAASVHYRPGEVAVAAKAVFAAATSGEKIERQIAGVEAEDLNRAASALGKALEAKKGNGKVVVVLGRASLAESVESVLEAANVFIAGADASVLTAMRRANLHGALDMGLAPGLLPGRVSLADGAPWFVAQWGAGPSSVGLDSAGMLQGAAHGSIKALVFLGSDPVTDFPDREVAAAIQSAEFVVSIDTHSNATNELAHIVLPAAGYAEKSGTTTNLEGRVTRVLAKTTAPGLARPDWMIATELSVLLGSDLGFETADDITAEIAAVCPSHLGLTSSVLSAQADGVLLPIRSAEAPAVEESAPADASAAASAEGTAEGSTESASSSSPSVPPLITFAASSTSAVVPTPDAYSLRLVTRRSLYDQGTLVSNSPSLAPLAKEHAAYANPGEIERHGLVADEPVRIASQTGDVVLPLRPDASLPRGVVVLPLGHRGPSAMSLIDLGAVASEGITKVRLESLDSSGGAA